VISKNRQKQLVFAGAHMDVFTAFLRDHKFSKRDAIKNTLMPIK